MSSSRLTVCLRGTHEFEFEGLEQLVSSSVVLTRATDENVDVLVDGEPSDKSLDALPNLRALVIPYSGLSGRTRQRLLARPTLRAYNLHHNAGAVAELTVALLLAAAKRVTVADRDLRQGKWHLRYADADSVSLDGATALIIGYGAIGRRTGEILRAFGMRVIGIRRGEAIQDGDVEVRPPRELLRSLGEANVVIVAVPKTPETNGMIGAAELDALPRGAVLVNVARGPIVDEAALFEALSSGRLGAAGIDVWYRYPREASQRGNTLPSQFPFHELDNVVLSPHRAGMAALSERLQVQHLAHLLNQLARGEEPASRINVEAGY